MRYDMKYKTAERIGLLVGVSLSVTGVLTSCSQATPSLAQCAVVTGHGFFDNQNVKSVVYPGENVSKASNETAWYVWCNARNYVVGGRNADVGDPSQVRTGALGTDPATPISVSTFTSWQLNQSRSALVKFMPFCLKFGCATNTDQTDGGNADLTHSSNPGWNNMLLEIMKPAVDAAVADAAAQMPPTVWVDRSQWTHFGELVSAALPAELAKRDGSQVPYFCGPGSTTNICTNPSVIVQNAVPTDHNLVVQYDEKIQAQQGVAVGKARRDAASSTYGTLADWALAMQDLVTKCHEAGMTCNIYVGQPVATGK